MNPNYTEFKFPQIKAHPWTKVNQLFLLVSEKTPMYSARTFWKKRPIGQVYRKGHNVVTSGRRVVVTSDTSGLDYPFIYPFFFFLNILCTNCEYMHIFSEFSLFIILLQQSFSDIRNIVPWSP